MPSTRAQGRPASTALAVAVLMAISMAVPLALPVRAQGTEPPAIVWGEDARLSNSTLISDDPVVAVTREGGTLVAWRERAVARYEVFFTVLDARGVAVVGRTQLGSGIPSSMDPDVAVDSRGHLLFVWTGEDDQELYYARTDGDGALLKGPLRLTNATGDSAEASTWVDARDHLHVVWFDARDQRTYLYYMQLDPEGRKVVEDRALLRVGTEQEVDIAMDGRGDLHVVWNSVAAPGELQWNYEMHYAKLSSTGEPLVADRIVATSRGSIGYPDIALDLGGNVHAVWPEGTSVRERVMYAQLDGSGRTIAGPLEVAGALSSAARDIAVGVDGNDRLQVVWSQDGPPLDGKVSSDLWWRALLPGGDPIGDPVQLTDARGDSSDPQLALSARGEPRVAWSDWRSGNAEVYLKVGNRPSSGVDLAVEAGGMGFDPPTPEAGEPVSVTVEVRSEGDATSPPATVAVELDGASAGSAQVPAIPAGGSRTVTVALGAPAEGEHDVVVVVDPAALVEEADETNNRASRLLVVHEPGMLVADAGPDQASETGAVVYLDATGTVYRGAGVLSHAWGFGDGSATGSGLYVEHVYDRAGTFTVTLTVSDGQAQDSDTCKVTVAQRNEPPAAVIAPAGPHETDRLTPLELSAAPSTDDDPSWPAGAAFEWDMGDGSGATGVTVSHTYTRLGLFVVTLTVTDAGGKFALNRTTVEVANIPPTAELDGTALEAKEGERFTLVVTSSDSDGTVAEVWWDVDASDGLNPQVTGATLQHAYEEAGTYNVSCVVRDSDGGQTTLHAQVVVKEGRTGSPIPGPGAPISLLAMAAAALASAAGAVARRRLV